MRREKILYVNAVVDMNERELNELVNRLLQLPHESEVVEFKHAENNFDNDDLGRYFSALSNEANLKGLEFGWLVFGIKNKTHEVLGTNYRNSSNSLHSMKKTIADQTTNRITFEEIYDFEYSSKRIVLFQIPAAPIGIPIAFKGHYYGREHESLSALNILEIEKIRSQQITCTFESNIIKRDLTPKEVLSFLDYKTLFHCIDRILPTDDEAVLDIMLEYGFVVRNNDSYSITNMGALLLANKLADFPSLDGRQIIVRRYNGTNNRVLALEQYGKKGYVVGFQGLLKFISDNSSEEKISVTREYIPTYPIVAIREFLANALVHQDFSIKGMPITIEIYANRLVITNPGKSLNDVNRLIDLPPHSRNEKLAQSMYLMHLCERRGSGYDRAVEAIEKMGLPGYQTESGDHFTRVTLYPKKSFEEMTKEERVLACYQHACLLYEDRMSLNNESVRERFGLDKHQSAVASHIITDTIDAGFIKLTNPNGMSRKFATYIPYYG